ncbi:potassium channel family protein [Chlamydiia bacterium]|nr:potassium channel family protein [Chlamydiia bacterium]
MFFLLSKLKKILAVKKYKKQTGNIQTEFLLLLLNFVFVVFFHSFLIMLIEGFSFYDSLWYTLTSMTTVGYGDVVPETFWGRFVTVFLVYFYGISILARMLAVHYENQQLKQKKNRLGDSMLKIKGHIAFVNCSKNMTEEYLFNVTTLLRGSRSTFSSKPLVVVSQHFEDGLTERLMKLNTKLVSKPMFSEEMIEYAALRAASCIVIFSRDYTDLSSDSINLDMVDFLREEGIEARLVVEVVNDRNRNRIKKNGADNLIRPTRTFPEFLVRSLLVPGSEGLLETLCNSRDEECLCFDIEVEMLWKDVVCKLVTKDYGLPVSYEGIDGEIVHIPSANDLVKTKRLFLLVNDDRHISLVNIRDALTEKNKL